ncbi:hypothetical protein A3715_15495 [Oleiphilus sp. HI0009]|nr:hypothetical protein A3715_15495 [Oleiphilus sp. HI0009]
MHVIKFFSIILFFSTSLSATEHTVFAPSKVVADKQNFAAVVKVENCPTELEVDGSHPFYCSIIWEQIPPRSAISEDTFHVFSPPLSSGSYTLRGTLNKYSTNDASKPISSSLITHNVVSENLRIKTVLNGLPIRPERTNRVWVSNDVDNSHRCIFYGGVPVETTPIKIEQGKVYCRIIWENIPPGFEIARKTDISALSGSILNIHSDLISDSTFSYYLEIYLPYDNLHTLGVENVSAFTTNLPAPDLKFITPKEGIIDYIVIREGSPTIPIELSGFNPENLDMVAKVYLTTPTDTVNALTSMIDNADYIPSIKTPDLINVDPGYVGEVVLSLSYFENQMSSTSNRINLLYLPPSDISNKVTHLSVDSTEVLLSSSLISKDSSYNNGYWRSYVTLLSSDLIDNTGPMFRQLVDPIHPISNVEFHENNEANFKFPLESIFFNRAVVVSELITPLPSNDELYVTYRIISDPVAANIIREKSFNTGDDEINYVTGPSPMYVIGLIDINSRDYKDISSVDWHYTNHNGMNSISQYSSTNIPYRAHVFHLESGTYDLTANVTIKSDEQLEYGSILAHSYSLPDVQILAPTNLSPNQNSVAELLVNGSKVDLSRYTASWYMDGIYLGDFSELPMNFDVEGEHIIEAHVFDRSNNDTPFLKSSKGVKQINVKFIDEKVVL